VELLRFLVGAAYKSTADISRDFLDPRTSTSVEPSFLDRSVSTTNGAMGLWRRQADSERQTGLDSTIQEVLTVVESGWRGNNKKSRDHEKWGPTLPIAPQPEVVWTNGVDRRIQSAKLV